MTITYFICAAAFAHFFIKRSSRWMHLYEKVDNSIKKIRFNNNVKRPDLTLEIEKMKKSLSRNLTQSDFDLLEKDVYRLNKELADLDLENATLCSKYDSLIKSENRRIEQQKEKKRREEESRSANYSSGYSSGSSSSSSSSSSDWSGGGGGFSGGGSSSSW